MRVKSNLWSSIIRQITFLPASFLYSDECVYQKETSILAGPLQCLAENQFSMGSSLTAVVNKAQICAIPNIQPRQNVFINYMV